MNREFVLLLEDDAIWAQVLVQVLKNNGIPCKAAPVYGAGLVVSAGLQERLKVYVPDEYAAQAQAILEDYQVAEE